MTHTRITALWNGLTGLPGYTRMSFSGSLDAAACATAAGRMRTFFDAMKAYIPSGGVITFSETAQVFTTGGVLTGELSYTPPAQVNGTGSGAYNGAGGGRVNWLTGAFLNGRRVRGRTYLVPQVSTAFDTNGTLSSGYISALTAAAAALVSGAPELVVISRLGPGSGSESLVTGASVPDRASVLRSRRD